MSDNSRRSIDWPDNNLAFMRGLPDGRLYDSGQDIAVWLHRADGFRWAADMACQYAESDECARAQTPCKQAPGVVSLGELHALSDKEVKQSYACLSAAPGPIAWFGLTCAAGALYRHSVELLLKVLVILGRRIQGKPSSFVKTHALERLWAEVRAEVLAIWPKQKADERAALDRATQHVKWLDTHDPDSTAFRYPSAQGLSRDDALPLMEELRAHVVPLGNYLSTMAEGMWAVLDKREDVPDCDPGT